MVEEKYKENWNDLKMWLKEYIKLIEHNTNKNNINEVDFTFYRYAINRYKSVLEKMEELEQGDEN